MARIKSKTKSLKKSALLCLGLACLILIAGFGINVARADWREPGAPPPTENISPPLTVSGEPQAKAGKLKLDPNFSPYDLTTVLTYPLEVVGTAKAVEGVAENLRVDNTLFVSADDDKVDIADEPTASTAKLTVYGGKAQIGTELNPVSGQALYGESVSGHGILGTTLASSSTQVYAGVSGENNNALGYGVWGLSSSSGVNARPGVYGQTVGGTGIYGVTNSYLYAAVYGENTAASNMGWAGYFEGNLGAGSDVVADRFLSTKLQNSIIPFTSGQQVANYPFGGNQNDVWLAFDGTYVWLATGSPGTLLKNLFKVRASDGKIIDSYRLNTAWGFVDVEFDGRYLWLAGEDNGSITRFDPLDASTQTVGGLSANQKTDLEVSSINGQEYIWAVDQTADTVLKINASTLSVETSVNILNLLGLDGAYRLEFDGEYIWLTTTLGNSIVKIWASDPSDADHPMTYFNTNSLGCDPYNVYFDGLNIWCLNGMGAGVNRLLRIWPDNFYASTDPSYDPRYPMETFGPAVPPEPEPNYQKHMAFDGTYLWTVVVTTSRMYRYLASDPSQVTTIDLGFQPADILFDGTYIWVSEGGVQPRLHRYYSGTGRGHTDLNTVVNLNPAAAQAGNINITGSAEVGQGLTVGGDLDVPGVPGNLWGGSDEIRPVSGGVADCAVDGHFIKGITVGADHKISEIICRGL